MDSELSQWLDEQSTAFSTQEFRPITKIYADLAYLQDIALGTILSTCVCVEELQYLHRQLPAYNERVFPEVASYFPALGLTDDRLQQLQQDPKQWLKICAISPFTSVYNELLEELVRLRDHNQRITGSKEACLFLQTPQGLPYPAPLLQRLKTQFTTLFPELNVEFILQTPYTQSKNFYLNLEELWLADLQQFVIQENTSAAFFSAEQFFEHRVLARPLVTVPTEEARQQPIVALQQTQAMLNLYCDFCYLPSLIPLGQPTKD